MSSHELRDALADLGPDAVGDTAIEGLGSARKKGSLYKHLSREVEP